MADLKGSSEHAAQHVHGAGVGYKEPEAPQTIEQRVARLERQLMGLLTSKEGAKPEKVAKIAKPERE